MPQPTTFKVTVPPKDTSRLAYNSQAEIQAQSVAELVDQSPLRLTTLVKKLGINVRTIKRNLESPGRLRVDEVLMLAKQLGLDVNELFAFIQIEAAEQARIKEQEQLALRKAERQAKKAQAAEAAKAAAKPPARRKKTAH